jgi:hypothetical protein
MYMRYIAYLTTSILLVGCTTTEKKPTKPLPSTQGVEASALAIDKSVSDAIKSNASAKDLINQAIKLNLQAQKENK